MTGHAGEPLQPQSAHALLQEGQTEQDGRQESLLAATRQVCGQGEFAKQFIFVETFSMNSPRYY